MPDECAIGLEDRPASTRRLILVVGSNPAELERGTTLPLDVAAIEVALHCDEPKAASAVGTDLDEGWTEKVHRVPVPEIHLLDMPAICRSRHHAPNVATDPRSEQHRIGRALGLRSGSHHDSVE